MHDQPAPHTTWLHPDTPARYGTVSRVLHWVMAGGFAWIFASAIAHATARDSALDSLLWPTHKHVGSVLMALALLRAAWALAQARQRPPGVSVLARLGHGALYALMLAIPAIGLLCQYGSGRAFAPLGLPLMPGFDASQKMEWAVNLGGLLHGELGWALLALVVGHIAAALWHQRPGSTPVLRRMMG